ncbi:TetR/AcrR family transcriptional regulator [soil metagenome]
MPYPAKTNPKDILEQAVTLLEQGEDMSMRSLAKALNLRASSLYRHYADRDALETAVAAYSANLLQKNLDAAREGRGAEEALQTAAHAYLDFARAHPALYDLLLAPHPLAGAEPGPFKNLWNTFLMIVGAVTHHPDDTDSAVALWSFLHGFLVLERTGLFGSSGPKGGFEVGLAALVKSLKAAS